MNFQIDNVFSQPEGIAMANELVKYLIEKEDVTNWDECLFSIMTDLKAYLDNEALEHGSYTASPMFMTEIHDKMHNALRLSRYLIKINESLAESGTPIRLNRVKVKS